ncbi:MAG TPA: energy-coupling factor transporter transmembrane protein EcfT [Clostridiales bacterium]|nr:energy-coupling factor transporter transmembrane protein EcfT [Clostridiales bacterium]
MKSLNPVCKFIGIFLPAILLAFFYRPALNLAVFAVCVAFLFLSRGVNYRHMGLFLIPVALLALGMFATGYQFKSDAYIGAQTGLFTDIAVLNGLQLSSRILAFAGLGMVFVLTTDKLEFVRCLEQQLRLPPKFTYGICAAWGMLPGMRAEYKKTRAAFRARGLHPGAVSPALLLPLLVKSVRWSEALACAMESKGFGESNERTHYYRYPVRAKDILFPVLFCAGTCVALVLW